MKRSNMVVFLGIIILGVCGGTFNDAFATEENNFPVKTEVVSENIKTYLENNLAVYLNGMLEIEGTSDTLKDYVLGVPFSLLDENTSSNSIVFPVLKNESVVYTFF